MNGLTSRYNLLLSIVFLLLFSLTGLTQTAQDLVEGNLIQFNDNGAWCWYQDERAVIDLTTSRLIIGSDASGSGIGGPSRNGKIEAVIWDLNSGNWEKVTLMSAGCDDHNTPAFLIRPDGYYLVMYAQHYDNYSRYRIYNGSSWSNEQLFDWQTIPGGSDYYTTYSNLFYLSAEDKVYNIVRSHARSPNLMVSSDQGTSWSYGGLLTQPDTSIGYVNGYFKYCINGADRIDFVCTEHHPRDYNTSIYHGYIKNNQSFNSYGVLMDSLISDKIAPEPADFTLVYAADTAMQDTTYTRCWTIDLQTYPDSTIATIFKTRLNDDPNSPSDDPDHVFFYARFDGSNWTSTYLGKAGKKLYGSEQDYTGLGTIHPYNPNIIYISTPFDPRDNSNLGFHEIFKGTTTDHGASWNWTPITQHSVRDNLRPIVPVWDENNTALLWWRGTYNSAQNFDAAIVGLLDRPVETAELMRYYDATITNTILADGSPLVTTGPDPNQGPADNQWHERTTYGNGGSVFTSAEISGENAPALLTRLTILQLGVYDIWVNFWANPTADWRIKAGLSQNIMQIFRQMACKQVEVGDHDTTLVLSGGGNTFLYQAYLGRKPFWAGDTLEVYVDDHAIQTGSSSTLVGNVARTWYDGISISRVEGAVVKLAEKKTVPLEFNLNQNYPNPFNPRTIISWLISSPAQEGDRQLAVGSQELARLKNTDGGSVTGLATGQGFVGPVASQRVQLAVYNIIGQEVVVLVNEWLPPGQYQVVFDAYGLASGIYLYRLKVGNVVQSRKMVLLK